jgi:hypothetical protein
LEQQLRPGERRKQRFWFRVRGRPIANYGLRLRVRWKSDQECWYLIGTEDSSTAQAGDAKFDSARE